MSRKKVLTTNKAKSIKETGGLVDVVAVAAGLRVMITRNIDVSVGEIT